MLKPGGVCIMTFSNRMFYQKAVAAWREADTGFGRVQAREDMTCMDIPMNTCSSGEQCLVNGTFAGCQKREMRGCISAVGGPDSCAPHQCENMGG